MAKIEFVSYDGAYPNYCDGNLIIKVDGKVYENLSIVSGGSCYFTDDYTNVGTFKNGMSTNLLANKKKKEVKSRVAVNE